MEDALTQWLLENRPYPHLHTRVKQLFPLWTNSSKETSVGAGTVTGASNESFASTVKTINGLLRGMPSAER